MSLSSRPPVRMGRVPAAAIGSMLALAMSGCGDAPDEVAYCTDADGYIVEEEVCEAYYDDNDGGGGGGYFIMHSSSYPSNAKPGDRLRLSDGKRFAYNDAAAREKLGLPRSGKIGAAGSGAKISGSKIGGGSGLFGGSGRAGGS